ncbi:D-2-hydroxyacid dehydrogenase family protein [Paenibacillus filicis]|uniref:D-2-hydroxyacid dehydrogenase family protein n=1 Tax=Paenibacillus gyeongsangnamensis TaxID=3388067 RepID=A0ABT4Q2C7_9BACL|nr:D-2-hydroxyacid dehydrogenase family protein [Paenibacillus filicis]MCZ8511032.1 D-2-hydroxyacid dehydrogenase family protein [Paenibacillus filicis]
MKINCAILDDYQNKALELADWSTLTDRVNLRVYSEHMDHEDKLVQELSDCEIVVIMRERTPFRASLLARLPRLKLLVTTGMRNASVDLAAADRQSIVVCGTAGHSESTAELTWALILGLARHVPQEFQAIRQGGPWQSTIGTDMSGKRLGVLGLGKLGSRVARVGLAFGMEVVAWSQNLTTERAEAEGVRLAASKEELLESSDVVTIHLVLSDRTRGLIGAAELERMRRTAYLINTSRAAIVDQAALAEALRTGRIAGAALDVFETEPLPENDIFRSLPNVLTTPHLGYVTEANYRTYFLEAVEDIEAYLNSSPVRRLFPQ